MARKVYTTGTMYEKETGRYQSEPWQERPSTRTKKVGTGKATATKGPRDKVASKRGGVGQESIDGFVNRSGRAVAKKALANQKKTTDFRTKRMQGMVAEYALGEDGKKPPRRKFR